MFCISDGGDGAYRILYRRVIFQRESRMGNTLTPRPASRLSRPPFGADTLTQLAGVPLLFARLLWLSHHVLLCTVHNSFDSLTVEHPGSVREARVQEPGETVSTPSPAHAGGTHSAIQG